MTEVVLKKIISGGQAGADIAALHATDKFTASLETGGICPYNYMTVNGRNNELQKYGLTPLENEGTLSSQYVKRSTLNIRNADATLAFRMQPGVGTDCSIQYALTQDWKRPKNLKAYNCEELATRFKPVCVVTQFDPDPTKMIERVSAFLAKHHVVTLNVCGNRDVCYETRIQTFLESLFTSLFNKKLK